MRLPSSFLLLFAITSIGCSSQGALTKSSNIPLAGTRLKLLDEPESGVVAEITIRNESNTAICISSRHLTLESWPFVVIDEAGGKVPGGPEIVEDSFGGHSEPYFLIGKGKELVRRLHLRGLIELPRGRRFTFSWIGYAFNCNDIAMVVGAVDELSRKAFVELKAEATLPR